MTTSSTGRYGIDLSAPLIRPSAGRSMSSRLFQLIGQDLYARAFLQFLFPCFPPLLPGRDKEFCFDPASHFFKGKLTGRFFDTGRYDMKTILVLVNPECPIGKDL